MPLNLKAMKKVRKFNQGVSYRLDEQRDRLSDALNVYTSKNVLHTRHGYSRFNDTQLSAKADSMSFFKHSDGTRQVIAKIGTIMYVVNSSGAATSIKTGLTSTTKHRAITLNDRHIIAIGSDGLFSWDGTNFNALGQAVPSAPSVAASGSGNTLTASDYQVACTFYASTIGFETNIGAASDTQTVASGEQIDVTGIPTTAANGLIDQVRIYLKDVSNAGEWIFWDVISLGTSTDTIDADPTSTKNPPTTHAAPIAGGGKYLTEFSSKLAYTGNATYPSDVYISETNLPDAFSDVTDTTLYAPGSGTTTGIATGLFNESELLPYLVIFKKRTISIYTEVSGFNRFSVISNEIGCLDGDTIKVINGDVYFMSESGWYAVVNGKLLKKDGVPYSLSTDINDIFSSSGYANEVNKSNGSNFFSVYYSKLDHYYTWVSEGSSTELTKAWVYEFETNGFKPYSFALNFVAGCEGEDSSGDEVIYLADQNGWIYEHSIKENRTDVDASNSGVDIEAYALMLWWDGDDFESSYNFRELILRALANSNDLTVKAFVNYDVSDFLAYTYTFTDPNSGFQLDVSKLDEGVFSDGRTVVTATADINRMGENILIGFYQQATNSDIALIAAQLNLNKNGNNNKD